MNIKTTKLNRHAGHAVVLAKPNGEAYTFVNLTQAGNKADVLAENGIYGYVIGSYPFFVAIPEQEPVISLTCSCCGGEARGRQWWNCDTGYGLCPKCAAWIATREGAIEIKSCYGVAGYHYFTKESQS